MATVTQGVSYTTFICVFIAICYLWRQPRARTPRGLNTLKVSNAVIAQLFFFPLIMYSLVNFYVKFVPEITILMSSNNMLWLLLPLLIFISFINAVLYWPIHMCIGDTSSYINRGMGIILILLQMTNIIMTMLSSFSSYSSLVYEQRTVMIVFSCLTYYVQFYAYSMAAITYLLYPPIWDQVFTYIQSKIRNVKVEFAYYLSCICLLFLTGIYMSCMINFYIISQGVSAVVNWFTPIDMSKYSTPFLIIGVIVPIVTYVVFMFGNYISRTMFLLDHTITVDNEDLLDYYDSAFKFVGVFIGKQCILYSLVCWLTWCVVVIIYILNLVGMLGQACKYISVTLLPPIIVLFIINEIYRTIVGIWLYGRSYRPWPRNSSRVPTGGKYNVYITHLEYFTFFLAFVLSIRESLFGGIDIKNVLMTVVPKNTKPTIIDIGYKKMDEQTLI